MWRRKSGLLNKMILNIRDLDEREAFIMLRDIETNILNLRCPKCNLVFIDFIGCFSIRCHCGVDFCGWCVKFHDTDILTGM